MHITWKCYLCKGHYIPVSEPYTAVLRMEEFEKLE